MWDQRHTATREAALGRAGAGSRRRRQVVAAVGALALGLLAACGGGDGSKGSPADPEVPETLDVAWSGAPISLDPIKAQNPQDLAVLHLIGGTLYEYVDDEVRLGLAKSVKTSNDGLTWTFTLRPDLKFSDGTPLTANDVVATYTYYKTDPATWFRGLLKPMAKMKAPDDVTVVFKLSRPYPSLPDVLTQSNFAVMPADRLEPEKETAAPISAGPYTVVRWGGGSKTVEMERNEHYWGAKPIVQALNFETVGDYQTRLIQLRSGQIDASTDFPPNIFEQLQGLPGITVEFVPTFGFYYMSAWNKTPPFDNLNVRKAIALALDRERMSEQIWMGEAEPSRGFWPSTMSGYDPSLEQKQDLDAAKELLKGTPCEEGCGPFQLITSSEALPWGDQASLLIQSDLAKIGIEVKIVNVDPASWASKTTKDFDLSLTGGASFTDSPDGMADVQLVHDGGGFTGYSGGFIPGMKELVERVGVSSGEEREAALSEINRLFLEFQPYFPLVDSGNIFASRYPASVVSMDAANYLNVGTDGATK